MRKNILQNGDLSSSAKVQLRSWLLRFRHQMPAHVEDAFVKAVKSLDKPNFPIPAEGPLRKCLETSVPNAAEAIMAFKWSETSDPGLWIHVYKQLKHPTPPEVRYKPTYACRLLHQHIAVGEPSSQEPRPFDGCSAVIEANTLDEALMLFNEQRRQYEYKGFQKALETVFTLEVRHEFRFDFKDCDYYHVRLTHLPTGNSMTQHYIDALGRLRDYYEQHAI